MHDRKTAQFMMSHFPLFNDNEHQVQLLLFKNFGSLVSYLQSPEKFLFKFVNFLKAPWPFQHVPCIQLNKNTGTKRQTYKRYVLIT
jgi:hypothetical protein